MAKKCILNELEASPYVFAPAAVADQIGSFAYTGRDVMTRPDVPRYTVYTTGEFVVQHERVPDNAGATEYREQIIPQEASMFREILTHCAATAQARDKGALNVVSKDFEASKGLPPGIGDKVKSYLGGRRRKTRRRGKTSKRKRTRKA